MSLRLDRDFTISLWAGRSGRPGGRRRRPRLRSSIPSPARASTSARSRAPAATTGPATSSGSRSASTRAASRAGVDCGRPSPTSNYVSNSLTVFEGSLYAATSDAPDEADRGHVYRYLGETRLGGSRPGRERGRARRGPADRPPRRALRGDLELRLDARPRPGSRALPRLPLRRPGPLGGLRAAGALQADLQPGLVPRRPARDRRRLHGPRPSRRDALGAGHGLRHVRASRDRPRRAAGARHAPAGDACGRSTAATGATSATPSATPERCDEIHSLVTFRGRAARRHLAARPRRPLGSAPPALAADRPARRQHRGDGAERLQRQALRRRDPARRGVPLRARPLVDEPAPPVRSAGLAARPGAQHEPAARRRPPHARVDEGHEPDPARRPAVRVGRQLHERRGRCAGGRSRIGSRLRRGSRRDHAAHAGAGPAPRRRGAAGRGAVGLRRRARGGHGARRRDRIRRDCGTAPHRRGRGRPLRRRDRRLPGLRPALDVREIKALAAARPPRRHRPCTTRRQRR